MNDGNMHNDANVLGATEVDLEKQWMWASNKKLKFPLVCTSLSADQIHVQIWNNAVLLCEHRPLWQPWHCASRNQSWLCKVDFNILLANSESDWLLQHITSLWWWSQNCAQFFFHNNWLYLWQGELQPKHFLGESLRENYIVVLSHFQVAAAFCRAEEEGCKNTEDSTWVILR